MFNDPFCWNEFLQVHHFFLVGGGRLFAGKTKANEKVSVPSAPSSGGYMLGTLSRWTQMLGCWNVASLKRSGFPLKISLPKKQSGLPIPTFFRGRLIYEFFRACIITNRWLFWALQPQVFWRVKKPKGRLKTRQTSKTQEDLLRLFEVVRSR